MNLNKNIVIIGGGPAGLEASARLHRMGYNVILVERSHRLGGHLADWDRLFPEGADAGRVLDSLLARIDGVKYFLNTEVNSVNLLEHSYNVILSNGITVLAGAVLMASGFDLFPAGRKEEYGYGIYDHVITNADLEAFFASRNDERAPRDLRVPEDPRKIGFVHCVGSRDEKIGNRHCSKVCCATAVKQACEIKEAFPQADVYCFYMDLRMFGRGYEDLYLKAQKDCGVRFIRGRVSEVAENIDKKLVIKAEDTPSGKPVQVTLDLLVLMSGMQNSRAGCQVGSMISLETAEDGFFVPRDSIGALQESERSGIFFAGACTGPKTLPDTLHEARAAALAIHEYLKNLE